MSSGNLANLVLEGLVKRKRDRGRERKTWGDDVKEWTNTSSIGIAKRVAETRVGWRGLVANTRVTE